jgi:hypothetical protein
MLKIVLVSLSLPLSPGIASGGGGFRNSCLLVHAGQRMQGDKASFAAVKYFYVIKMAYL